MGQDLATDAQVLRSKTPNSGTADRALVEGALGGLLYGVGAHTGLLGAAGPYAAAAGPGILATGALYGVRPITKYAVGGFPGQEPATVCQLHPASLHDRCAEPGHTAAAQPEATPVIIASDAEIQVSGEGIQSRGARVRMAPGLAVSHRSRSPEKRS